MISSKIVEDKHQRWQQAFVTNRISAHPAVALPKGQRLTPVDLSGSNPAVASLDVADTAAIGRYLQQVIQEKGAAGALGGYLENRSLYHRSKVFAAEEHRTLHLGIDIWLPAGTAVYAVLPGQVHSFADNAGFGNYGPTIILEHDLRDITFYTLYGHLSRPSLDGLKEGRTVAQGDQIGTLGAENENGDWPPHLHFQVMLDMDGNRGDFPGVAAPSQKTYYSLLCPDPMYLLTNV